MRALLDIGRVRGAWRIGPECLVTLDELTDRLPEAANLAYYLQAQTDGRVVVDSELGCPEEVLTLPGVQYSETSMSGRGYHLVTALPDNFYEFTAASGKRVLRESHGSYELLLDHWVTFTRRPIAADVMEAAQHESSPREFASVGDLYASLARSAKAKCPVSTGVRATGEAPPIKGGELIVERTLEGARPWLRTLYQFDGDCSRWEFSILGTLFREMRDHLVRVGFVRRTEYTSGDQAWLLYRAALETSPERPKHHERRNGRPFLLDRAAAMVASSS
ncbi:hypothetical protein [Brevibacterium casei]|uniref:hypothetical protein n=1 Tax=Brevibacterium casei TaxID=33889 RepID=UPI001C920FC5|nr:hypothetical protein [Brevibacterium casei]